MKNHEFAPDNYSDSEAGDAAARIAAELGSATEWDYGMFETIADILHTFGGFRHPGNSENNAYYVHQQRLYGITDEDGEE